MVAREHYVLAGLLALALVAVGYGIGVMTAAARHKQALNKVKALAQMEALSFETMYLHQVLENQLPAATKLLRLNADNRIDMLWTYYMGRVDGATRSLILPTLRTVRDRRRGTANMTQTYWSEPEGQELNRQAAHILEILDTISTGQQPLAKE